MNEFDSLFAVLKICCDCRLIIINFRVFMEFGSWFYFEANVDKRRGFWDLDFFLFEDEFEKSLLLLRTKLKWVFFIQMIWIWIRNCHFIHNCGSVFFFFPLSLPSLSSHFFLPNETRTDKCFELCTCLVMWLKVLFF